MILFQDFYNANELFDYLAENSVFLGGELGNPDSWFVPPKFFKRYWFLCPNHKRKRMDNAVEIMVKLGKQMIELMEQRKQMYIDREHHADYFPQPTTKEQTKQIQHAVDQEFLYKDDQQYLDEIYQQQHHQQQQEQQCMELFDMEQDSDMIEQAASSTQQQQLNLLDSHLPLGMRLLFIALCIKKSVNASFFI